MNLDFFGLLPHYLFLAIAADNLYLQFISIYNLYISNKEAGRKKMCGIVEFHHSQWRNTKNRPY